MSLHTMELKGKTVVQVKM